MKKPLIAPNKLSRPLKNYLGKEGLEKLLKQHFGYSGFREKQLEAIEASLSGRDCFCLMPTGGGKSMCYQIPALATSGIVLENQVMALKANGVCANFLSSTQLACIKEKIHEDLNSEKPSVKLLYVTPELVATSGFIVKLINLYNRGLLSLIAVDEGFLLTRNSKLLNLPTRHPSLTVHCTLGGALPSYRKLSSLRSHIPGVPIIALTATAVSKVQEDVIKSLQLQNPLILRTSFNRPNIYYEVRFKDLLNDVYADLANLLKSSGEGVCSIIYCLERSTCEDLSSYLSKNGISSAAYHAGLNSKLRSTVLDDWLSSRILVVVATVAFGMGIDKKDVRVVCHFNIPKSMEAFYQESGRAGRDQKPSRSVLYYGLDDRKRMEFILSNGVKKKSQSLSSSEELLKKSLADFKEMAAYCEGSCCRRRKILQNFGEQVSLSLCQKSCDACKYPSLLSTKLADLERNGNSFKKGGLTPVFLQRSIVTASDPLSEFWNREENANTDEDISESEDEAMVAECSARSKISSKATPDEKFEALQRAEEIYYQNKVQNKQVKRGLADRNIISQALREASKKRLLNALNQAKERLRNHSFDVDASSVSLELDCFKKYEKVGKTFYNSQVAATVRWLSSASSEQISERLGQNSATCDAENKPKVLENAATSSSSNPANQLLVQPVGEEQVKDEGLEEYACEPAAMEFSHGKVNLPPIPSFSEFVTLKSKSQERSPSIGSVSAPKRRAEADMNGRIHVDKKKKHNQNIV